jgi:predicted GIY-YIG superfamily endonuclease
MGSTITMNIAIECTQKNHPWDPAQIVVGFSRSERCDKIYIVTDDGADGAVQRIWETLCVRTQWTAMSQDIINKLAITAPCNGGREVEENKNILDVNDTFPWRICDFQLPTSYSGGCIYLLTSVNNTEFIDVGQTKRSIAERLDEHQRGQGNRYTNYHAYRPFAVAAFICNLGKDMDRSGRQKLESRWQGLNELSKKSGKGNLMNCMNNGVDVVKEYNEGISDVSKHIRLVKVFRPKAFE